MKGQRITWHNITVGQLGDVVTGTTPPTRNPDFYGYEYPFITPTDIDHDSRVVRTDRFLSEEGRAKFERRMLPPGAICFVCIGATIGKVCMTTRLSLSNQQINSIIVDKTRHDSKFVYYLLRYEANRVKMVAGGAATPIVNKSAFSAITLTAPPRPIQRKIAAILSTYDDLIENNTRRIAILEELARLVYREWFVHFRFPGHEGVRMVESELGVVLEGWKPAKFSDVAEIVRRPIEPHRSGSEVFAHYSFPAFDTQQLPLLEEGKTIFSGKFLLEVDCILLAKLNPRIPRIWLVFLDEAHRAIASSEFLVIHPKAPVCLEYLFCVLQSLEFLDDFAALTVGTSTSHQRVKPQDFLDMGIALPPYKLVAEFGDLVAPILRMVHDLRSKNLALRRTRDLLLPRLVSGEVDVSELDIKMGE